jgi:hypothetical protein
MISPWSSGMRRSKSASSFDQLVGARKLAGLAEPKNPMVGSFAACCARAPSRFN